MIHLLSLKIMVADARTSIVSLVIIAVRRVYFISSSQLHVSKNEEQSSQPQNNIHFVRKNHKVSPTGKLQQFGTINYFPKTLIYTWLIIIWGYCIPQNPHRYMVNHLKTKHKKVKKKKKAQFIFLCSVLRCNRYIQIVYRQK